VTWRLGSVVLVALVVGLAAASSARATTRALGPAMQRYALCRAATGAHVAGGISSAYRGQVVQVLMMSNGAQLIVRYGRRHHDATWVTSHEVSTRLFTFRHVRNVPRRLREACR
jgi:hypothetical protein